MQTILHLTDIHFGWEGDALSGQAERKVCLNGMLDELRKLETQWKPTIICITGDIAWRGAASDYEQASKWLKDLLDVCGLTCNDLILCAGNHDVIRSKAEKVPRPGSAKEADEALSPPIADHFEGLFSEFTAFCKTLGLPALKFGTVESYLVGVRTIKDIRFIVLYIAS